MKTKPEAVQILKSAICQYCELNYKWLSYSDEKEYINVEKTVLQIQKEQSRSLFRGGLKKESVDRVMLMADKISTFMASESTVKSLDQDIAFAYICRAYQQMGGNDLKDKIKQSLFKIFKIHYIYSNGRFVVPEVIIAKDAEREQQLADAVDKVAKLTQKIRTVQNVELISWSQ